MYILPPSISKKIEGYRWQSFTPPAAGKSRRFRGLICHRRSHGAFFVTRAKSNIDAHRVYSAPTDRSTGIICDQTISLDGFYTRQDYPELLRRIRFKDPESGKTLVFITNNFSLPAATICALYKSR